MRRPKLSTKGSSAPGIRRRTLTLFANFNSKHCVPHYNRRFRGSFELSTCLYLMRRHVFTSQGSYYQTSPVQETWHSDLTLTGLCRDVTGRIATSRQGTNEETERRHLYSVKTLFWHQLIWWKVTREESWHCLCLPAAARTHTHTHTESELQFKLLMANNVQHNIASYCKFLLPNTFEKSCAAYLRSG